MIDADFERAFLRILGDEIRSLRKRRGWTRKDLRERLNEDISLQTLATYELGTRNLTVARLLDICNALDTTPADVMKRAYKRWRGDLVTGWTIDLYEAARLEAPELTPLRNWAIVRIAELSNEPLTTVPTAFLTGPALEEMAKLCGIDPSELVQQLPRPDLSPMHTRTAPHPSRDSDSRP